MGDDLGDDWGVEGLDSGDEGTSTAAAAAAVAPKTATKKKNKANNKKKNDDSSTTTTTLAGRKRGRSQLSPEGFEETDSSDGDGEEDQDEEEQDEESRLKAAEEEEARLRRAEKKKQKLKAFKAKLKEKKKQRSQEESPASAAATKTGDGGERGAKTAAAVTNTVEEEAEELWARFCKVRGDLVTPLELDFPWITAGSLARVEGFGAHTAMKLVGFIKASLPDWKKRIQNRNSNAPRGSPSVLIVCTGARRCVEVMKHLTAFRCQVVKLFAKHLKIEEQKVMLRKGCFPLGVGTPGRMRALAAAGSLRLDSSALVILDLEKNVKGRSVLDMDGVSGDTMAFLSDCVRPHLVSAPSGGGGGGGGGSGKKKKGGGGGGGGPQEKGAATGQLLRIALY
ncbi:conserved unknown protein [Ectocarpus siliculosus]|uniref:Uncharacterized protein n=1 Tax=Ectocarpus siliculosus TaxID=2880 RepID=D7FI26_ECTSI|nr:conserved unknown protein [Ectocarpus siliculosus]|eukprot:CBJ28652.1 conserved unknown protein [Ectocarpus siliculosus]